MDLKDLIIQAERLEIRILNENSKRQYIKESEAYQFLVNQIEWLMETQEELLSEVEDSMPQLQEVKLAILEQFKEKGLEEYENAFAKFKTKQSVNVAKLLNTIGGDIDIFCTLADVSQKKLKEYAKDNKDIKKALLGCIQTDSKELVDITIKY